MRILIDLDSIIVNLQDEWYRRINATHGGNLKPEDVTDWDISKFSPAGEAVYKVLHEPGLFACLPPLPGAIDGVNSLLDHGHEVYIVSAAVSAPARAEKPEWVQKYLPRVGKKRVVLTGSKHVVQGDVLFDDGPTNITDWLAAWPNGEAATIAYPYNQGVVEKHPFRLFVAGDWKDTQAAWVRFVAWAGKAK